MRFWIAAVLLAGCGDGGPAPAPPRANGQLSIVRAVDWPGGGYELTVRVSNLDGTPFVGGIPEFQMSWDDGQTQSSLSATPLPTTSSAFAVAPGPEAVSAFSAYLDSRPENERIGVFRLGQELTQLANFTTDRELLLRQAAELAEPGELAEQDPQLMVVADLLGRLEGQEPRVARGVVSVGESSLLATEDPIVWAPTPAAMSAASDTLDTWSRESYFRLAVCAPEGGTTGTLRAAGLQGELAIEVPAVRPEARGRGCELSVIEAGERDIPSRLEIVFSAGERATYEKRVADVSAADFDAGLVVWPGTEAVEMTAHLRGKGTFQCERKNFTIDLKGGGRTLFANSRTDEYYLLSMCADDRYIEQYTANQLLAELGLFPIKFRYVELLIDGETQGVYLLLEKIREEITRDNSRVQSVLRRRFSPPEDSFEFKWASSDDSSAVPRVEDLLASFEGLSGQELIVAAEARMNLESYLRWLAMMTAYENGDYVDEVWFYDTESAQGGYYDIAAWDNDDLFSDCHFSSAYAYVDPNELIYCAESRLDKKLLADPVVYERYVDTLESLLLDEVTPERFDVAVESTADSILPYFARPEICAASTRFIADNPAAVEPSVAQADIRAALDQLKSRYRTRHALLLERIATYRGSN